MIEFQECNECRKKPGTPVLCPQCQMLRQLVSEHAEPECDIPFTVGPMGQAIGVTEDDVAARKIEKFGNVTIVMQPNHMAVHDGDRLVIGNDDGRFVELTEDLIVAIDSVASVERFGYEETKSRYTKLTLKTEAKPRAFYDPDWHLWERLRKAMGLQT